MALHMSGKYTSYGHARAEFVGCVEYFRTIRQSGERALMGSMLSMINVPKLPICSGSIISWQMQDWLNMWRKEMQMVCSSVV
ncbi:hypothetical protein RHMOL_Rhmol12G0097600 [Rhododendron molle]|uniref:Uncharacterized protein n=1 Tax=Rhododendron molle TaxID=49168 RepID=A0ACC0LHW7_RHOML|nr:hypothetical protein RHMOL_Rhmol12G0097600 [Rhododendron molle]